MTHLKVELHIPSWSGNEAFYTWNLGRKDTGLRDLPPVPIASCVWTSVSQLARQFQEVMEPLGGGVLMEEVGSWGQNLRFYKLGPLPVHTHLPDLWQHEQEPHTPAATQLPCLPPTMSCTPNPSKGRHVGPEEKKCDYCTGETWRSGCSYLTSYTLNSHWTLGNFSSKYWKAVCHLTLEGMCWSPQSRLWLDWV